MTTRDRDGISLRLEPCQPYIITAAGYLAGGRPPVSITDIVRRLDYDQLARLVCAFSGADPEAFERWLLEVTTTRRPGPGPAQRKDRTG